MHCPDSRELVQTPGRFCRVDLLGGWCVFCGWYLYKVLVLLFSSKSAKWQGPFVVMQWESDVDYKVVHSDRGGPPLKAWRETEPVSLWTLGKDRCDNHVTLVQTTAFSRGILSLAHSHHTQHFETHPGVTVCSWSYRLSVNKRQVVQKELAVMLEMSVIGELHKDGSICSCAD